MSQPEVRPPVTLDRVWAQVAVVALAGLVALTVVLATQVTRLRADVTRLERSSAAEVTGDDGSAHRTLVELCAAIGAIARAQGVSLSDVWSPDYLSECEMAATGNR